MYLEGYENVEIFGSRCNLSFTNLYCHAHLNKDISPLFPYINARLGAYEYLTDPPALIFKVHGRLITLHADKIAINALKDQEEAYKILDWLLREINRTDVEKAGIEPSYKGAPKPNFVKLMSLLPKTNCRRCGQATCLVFATRLAEGSAGPADCPPLLEDEQQGRRRCLEEYLEELMINRDLF